VENNGDQNHEGRGDEPTGRTRMAQDAIHEAYRAQSSVYDLRKTLKRSQGIWGSLTFLALVGGAGFGLATYLSQFETREKAKTLAVVVEDTQREIAGEREAHRYLNERIKRLEDKLDKLTEQLMSRQRR
jgi:hypothetical protein